MEVHFIMRFLTGILLLCATACAFGQTLPVKEGLWENTVFEDDGSVSMRTLDCVTQKSFAETMSKANKHPGCTVTNQNISSHGFVIDVSCNITNIQSRVHSVLELIDPEHQRTTITMTMTMNGKSENSTTKSTGHFIKADCGKVKPGDPEILSK